MSRRSVTLRAPAVIILTMAAAGIYITYGLVQYSTFRIGPYDLVIFDQAVAAGFQKSRSCPC